MNGIPEGTPQIVSGSSIPFEVNFDLLNGIDYDKGCYLGQELVARTHYRGAVRKRLFPLVSLGSPSTLISNASTSASKLLQTLTNSDLATSEHSAIPGPMVREIVRTASPEGAAAGSSTLRMPAVNVELDPIYSLSNLFPAEASPLLPIRNETDLEAVLAGKGLGGPVGAASASRMSKIMGGSSWNAGMGMIRTDDWHSSPSLLFYAPSQNDPNTGTILKGIKPWWYSNYLHWREEAESKATALAAEEL